MCIKTFDLMIDLLVARTIMRLKFTNNCFLSFDLMINYLAASAIMTLKFAKNAFLNFDLMKNAAIRRSNHYYKF
jgi:hypothetical protein